MDKETLCKKVNVGDGNEVSNNEVVYVQSNKMIQESVTRDLLEAAYEESKHTITVEEEVMEDMYETLVKSKL